MVRIERIEAGARRRHTMLSWRVAVQIHTYVLRLLSLLCALNGIHTQPPVGAVPACEVWVHRVSSSAGRETRPLSCSLWASSGNAGAAAMSWFWLSGPDGRAAEVHDMATRRRPGR